MSRARKIRKAFHFYGDMELDDVGCNPPSYLEMYPDLVGFHMSGMRVLPGGRNTAEDYRRFPVTRTAVWVVTASPHQCDWRCEGGKIGGDCECECRGRNHGRANMVCTAVV